ncbi:uncharacterized protein LOC116253520 [Nymphaea colorata]|uniref:uncharacterized protein LOC116253520 n=1 Tax=Nymphaea colorata TaxID=210225 RepID=UPI00214E57E5|nr:uncharacterized protein LOC116253520 [Nymphaea colorata]
MSSLLLLPSFLFLFFSSQLCEGRHLFMAFDDVVDRGSKMTKTYELSYENENSALVKVENRPKGELMRGKPDERMTEHGKHTVEGGKRRAAEGVQKTDSMISGTESFKPSSHNVKRQPNRLEVSQKLDRSAVEFHFQEGENESTALDVSDIVINDYPEPHRNPPANNEVP